MIILRIGLMALWSTVAAVSGGNPPVARRPRLFPASIGRDDLHMTWDQVREIQAAGMTIGSHSKTHPLMTKPTVSLPDELEGSRRAIEQHIGVSPDLFANPFGARDSCVADAVRQAGYRAARAYPRYASVHARRRPIAKLRPGGVQRVVVLSSPVFAEETAATENC